MVVREGGSGTRGQSGPIALILIFAIVITGVTIAVAMGATELSDSQDQLRISTAEKAMTQMDSEISRVALGSSRSTEIELPSHRAANYEVRSDHGRMNVSYETDSGRETILNTTMGAVVYSGEGNTEIAYQGGGIWRRSTEGGSVPVSPPELHYREGTLTLPLVTIHNNATVQNTAVLTSNNTTQYYPTASNRNPLEGKSVTVEVTSRYHEAWYSYLQTRTDGDVQHYPSEDRVVMTLTVPVTIGFENAVEATSDDSNAISHGGSPHGGFDSPTKTGVTAPPADRRIEAAIDDCEAGNCRDLSTHLSNGTLKSGTYYAGSATTIDETDYDTSRGNITLVVDGDLSLTGSGGPPGTVHHEILDNDNVTVYLNGSLSVSGNTGVNTGGDPTQLLVLIHSDGGNIATASGTPQFTGLIYAPNSSLTINGGGAPSNDNIVGSVVVEEATANGNGNLRYEPSFARDLEFTSENAITYLHVSNNAVNVTGA
jgi:hypothetical protein